jgi:predicted CoA-substrate-specific enzyme activase
MISAGIDAGSRAIKVVLFEHDQRRILGCGLAHQGVEQVQLVETLYADTLRQAGLDRTEIRAVVATGYGRQRVALAQTTITEITCHARGVHHLAPETRSIIEIGGQDSKVIRLDAGGKVRDFAMNDRCAAGTGRFLEVLASRLALDWPALDDLSRQSRQPACISNTCVVFAETEIIGLLAEGVPAADIAAGVQNSIATRVMAMVGRGLEPPAVFTGGVALQPGMARALETALGCPLRVAPDPQFTGALGAAILAGRGWDRSLDGSAT